MDDEEKLCIKFLDNPDRDPRNGRNIEPFQERYEEYIELCLIYGYRKDVGELRTRERLVRERERQRNRTEKRILPPRVTNSPEKIEEPVIRRVQPILRSTIPSVKPITVPTRQTATVPVLKPATAALIRQWTAKPVTNSEKVSRYDYYQSDDEGTDEESYEEIGNDDDYDF